jgi:hypothetical protein
MIGVAVTLSNIECIHRHKIFEFVYWILSLIMCFEETYTFQHTKFLKISLSIKKIVYQFH